MQIQTNLKSYSKKILVSNSPKEIRHKTGVIIKATTYDQKQTKFTHEKINFTFIIIGN
jgi:hypothetical protein